MGLEKSGHYNINAGIKQVKLLKPLEPNYQGNFLP